MYENPIRTPEIDSDPSVAALPEGGLYVSREQRQALYSLLLVELTGITDVRIVLVQGDVAGALRHRRRFEGNMRLLDDLGWEPEPDQERFGLTMAHNELRPLLERIYWSSVRHLADSEELTRDYEERLRTVVAFFPALLSQIDKGEGS